MTVIQRHKAVLVDLDGTLVNVQSIRHFVQNGNSDFDSFHRASVDCPVNVSVSQLVSELGNQGFAILIVTSRSEKYRRLTDFWLASHYIDCNELVMRGLRDDRPDLEVKNSMFMNLQTKYDVKIAIDDRDDLLENWLVLGIEGVYKVGGQNGQLQRLR